MHDLMDTDRRFDEKENPVQRAGSARIAIYGVCAGRGTVTRVGSFRLVGVWRPDW